MQIERARKRSIPLLPRLAERIIIAYTGSSAKKFRPPPVFPRTARTAPRRAPHQQNPPPFSHFDLWQGAAENKRGRLRSPRRRPHTCTTAHACNCNGAPPAREHRRGRHHKQPHQGGSRVKSTARAAAAYIYSSHREGSPIIAHRRRWAAPIRRTTILRRTRSRTTNYS